MLITKDFIILFVGLIICSILYVLATFGYKYLDQRGYGFKFIYLVSLLLGIILYSIKIPLFYYYDLSNTIVTYILYMTIMTFVLILYSKFVLHENIESHTYIILTCVIGLVILNEYLSSLDKK